MRRLAGRAGGVGQNVRVPHPRARSGLFAPSRDRALVLLWIVAGTVAVLVLLKIPSRQWMIDGATFHNVWRSTPMYGLPPNTPGAYLYSPLFAQIIAPVTQLPWSAFWAVWLLASCVAYVWLVLPVGWVWAIPFLALALEDVTIGNTAWLMAAACVLGMRWPVAWAIPLLMKVTTGVGVIWFVARKDWRSLAIALGAAGMAVAASRLVAPELWQDWIDFLSRNRSNNTLLPLRVVLATGVVWYASVKDRAWLIPIAMYLATPVQMVYGLGMLAAIPRLLPAEVQQRAREPFGTPIELARRVLDLPPVK